MLLPPPLSRLGFFPVGNLGAASHLGLRSANTQLSRVLEGSAERVEAREECRQTAQSHPPAKDNCSQASFSERLIFMLHVKRLRQLVHSEAFEPAPPRQLRPRKWSFNRRQMNMSNPIIPQRVTRPAGGGEQPRDSDPMAELSLLVPTPPVRGNQLGPWTLKSNPQHAGPAQRPQRSRGKG